MTKTTKDMSSLIAVGFGLISTGILIINFFGSPVNKVDAKVDNIASVVSELKTRTAGDIEGIRADVKNIKETQKESREDVKEILKRLK